MGVCDKDHKSKPSLKQTGKTFSIPGASGHKTSPSSQYGPQAV